MDPLIARKTWRTPEMIHGFIYFAPEAAEAYAAIGVTGRAGYFASRSAPIGATSAEVVIATFFNFEPGLVRPAMAGVWSNVTPEAMLDARRDAARAGLRRILGPRSRSRRTSWRPRASARRAAEAACAHLSGKPLFAGHASLPWPDEPIVVLWHAQTLLREFRGDIHIGAMTAEGIDGCEALVTHAASGEITARSCRAAAHGRTTDGTRRSSRCAPRATSTPRALSPRRAPRAANGSRTKPTRVRSSRTPPSATTDANGFAPSAGRCRRRLPRPPRSTCRGIRPTPAWRHVGPRRRVSARS